MNVLLVSIGTDGDIYPYVGLGKRLVARGHTVRLVASEHYQPLAAKHGLEFSALISTQENSELFDHPDFWHPQKTVLLSSRWGKRFLKRQYELLASLIDSDTVLVANPGVFAALLVSETHDCPMATLVLQPGTIPSSIAPPAMPGFAFLRKAPPWIWKMFWVGLDGVGYAVIGRELNRMRTSLGLKPTYRLFQNWLSPHLALGMFPSWYGPPQPDWPKQLQLTGFPLFQGNTSNTLPDEVLRFCRAGAPPIVFTFGTGMRHSAHLFRTAIQATELSGQRSILMTKHRDQLQASLPSNILHCEFAPFSELFQNASAVVHHGGIGTAAQAMAAGVPQLILPICFDQEDNGLRIQHLGIGDMLPTKQQTPDRISQALKNLQSPNVLSACKDISKRLDANSSLEDAASHIERLSHSAKR